MTSSSNGSRGRSTPYEKMLVADTFLIIGCILLSFGLGLSFYFIPVSTADSYTTLAPSNATPYSQNFTIHLDQGDALNLGVKPYALANVSLLLTDPNSQTVVKLTASEVAAFLNFTYHASSAGDYTLIVWENLTDQSNRAVSCQLEIMLVVYLGNPVRPYMLYGIVAVTIGLASLLFSRRAGPSTRKPSEWYEPRSYILPSLLLISTVGFALLFSTYILTSTSQPQTTSELLLIAFTALNVYSLLIGIITLQGKPLLIFLNALFVSMAVWFITLCLAVILLPSAFLQPTPYSNPDIFLRSMSELSALDSAFYQVEIVVVILVITYCLSYRYGRHRIYSYQVDTELVEAGTLKGLLNELETCLAKKNIEEFFTKLKEKDLEASVFLFYILSEHLTANTNSFTYHSIIAERRDVFSKDIYERDPAQGILKPLGFLKISGKGRFKRYRLQLNRPIVNRLTTLFKGYIEKGENESLAKWAGVNLLKERRMRYAGQLKDKNEDSEQRK